MEVLQKIYYTDEDKAIRTSLALNCILAEN